MEREREAGGVNTILEMASTILKYMVRSMILSLGGAD